MNGISLEIVISPTNEGVSEYFICRPSVFELSDWLISIQCSADIICSFLRKLLESVLFVTSTKIVSRFLNKVLDFSVDSLATDHANCTMGCGENPIASSN